jgi:hypothetical protein
MSEMLCRLKGSSLVLQSSLHLLQQISPEMSMSRHLLQATNPFPPAAAPVVLKNPRDDHGSNLLQQSLSVFLDGLIHLKAIVGDF